MMRATVGFVLWPLGNFRWFRRALGGRWHRFPVAGFDLWFPASRVTESVAHLTEFWPPFVPYVRKMWRVRSWPGRFGKRRRVMRPVPIAPP